jgi:hypothetical protein
MIHETICWKSKNQLFESVLLVTLFIFAGIASACSSQPEAMDGTARAQLGPAVGPTATILAGETDLAPDSSAVGSGRALPDEVEEVSAAVAALTPEPDPSSGRPGTFGFSQRLKRSPAFR